MQCVPTPQQSCPKNKSSTRLHEKITAQAKEKRTVGHCVGLCVDRWENIAKEHVEGTIACIGGCACATEVGKTGTEHDSMATAHAWERLMVDCSAKFGTPISHHCSDDAGQCARAQRILRQN